MKNALLVLVLPSLMVGGAGGFVLASLGNSPSRSGVQDVSVRERFLSSSDRADTAEGEIDYNRLARVCMAAGQQGRGPARMAGSALAEPNSPEVLDIKEKLDGVMSNSLGSGIWTRGAAFRARTLVARLPPSDVANFQELLLTTIDNGDMKPQEGAWVPRKVR